jgi:hypothetical protein
MARKWAIFITQPGAGLFAEQTKKKFDDLNFTWSR